MYFQSKNFLFLLFSLIPLFLILGPAIPEMIITIIIIFFFKENFSYKNIKEYIDKIFLSFLLFFIYIFLNSLTQFLNNEIDFKTLIKSFFLIRFVFFYLSIKWLSKFIDYDDIKKFYNIIFFTILFVLIDLVIQYFLSVDFFGYKAHVHGTATAFRLTGPFGDELIAGSYIMRFGFIFPYVSILLFDFKNKFFLFCIFIILSLVIFITGERAAFIIFIFGTFLFFIFKKNFFITIIYLISIFSLILLISTNNQLIKKRMFGHTLYQLGFDILSNKDNSKVIKQLPKNLDNNIKPKVIEESYKDIFLNKIRQFINNPYGAHYETAYNMFRENPLFGAGYKQFRVRCSDKKYFEMANSKLKSVRCSTHPHNLYFEILSENGIVGFVIFCFIILSIFQMVLIKRKKNYFLICQLILFFFPIISSGSFFTNKNLIYIFFIIGLSFVFKNKKDLKTEKQIKI
jgi:O-antigen ligase